MRHTLLALLASMIFCTFAPVALASGGNYVFDGGTPAEQANVTAALNASSFDWSVIPGTISVHIGSVGGSYAAPGAVFLDSSLLDSGSFAWGVVQHEFAHQVDFLMFDDADRAELETALGGKNWCYTVAGLPHSAYGCERFASELAWAYWPSSANCMSPVSTDGESGGMPVAAFRSLVAQILGVPTLADPPPATTKAYAPPVKAPKATKSKPKPRPKLKSFR